MEHKLALAIGGVILAGTCALLGYDFGFDQGRITAPNVAYVCGMEDGVKAAQRGGRDSLPPKGAGDRCAAYRDQVWYK